MSDSRGWGKPPSVTLRERESEAFENLVTAVRTNADNLAEQREAVTLADRWQPFQAKTM